MGGPPTSTRSAPLLVRAVARLAALLLRGLGATWRVRIEGVDPLSDPAQAGRAQIGAIWHRNILIAAWYFRDARHAVGISPSRDGDWISALLDRLGYAPAVRGSSSRGGAASLRALVRRVEAGTTTAVLADGPRGPARRAKPGLVVLASRTGRPVTPVAFACRPAIRFASWDGTLLPLPFARVVCAYGEPVSVPHSLDRAQRETYRSRLESSLERMTERLDAALGA